MISWRSKQTGNHLSERDNTNNQSVWSSMRQSGKEVDFKENQEPSQWLREERHFLAKTGIRYLKLI